VQYESALFWDHSGTYNSMADDLRFAHVLMDLSESTRDFATARECYEKAREGHDAVDRLLRRQLPVSSVAREELGAAISRLRSRLSAYENNLR
jgi:hypothetical protein